MIPFRKSLSFRVFLISFLLLTLPLLLDSFVLLYHRFKMSIKNAKNFLIDEADQREFAFSLLFPIHNPIAVLVENALNLKNDFPTTPSPELNAKLKILANKGNYEEIMILQNFNDLKYVLIGSSQDRKDIGQDVTDFINSLWVAYASQETEADFNLIYVSEKREHFFMNGRYIYPPNSKEPVGIIIISTNSQIGCLPCLSLIMIGMEFSLAF